MRPLTQRAMEPTKASFATTQWDQEVESATAPDGHVRVHQSQAAPFSVGLPSGLARSQQLYMMQRFLNIPATPSYVAKDDGLVLDRVVVNVGGRSWWQTLTLRLRAQRAWNTQEFSKGKPHQVLGDPSMYALGGRFRVGFGAHTVLRGLGELGSLSGAVEDFRRFKRTLSRFGGGDDADADASRAANVHGEKTRKDTSHGDDTFRGRVTLQTKAFAGHLVSFDASLRERYQTPRKYIDGPSFLSASITSRGPRWFNYRLGVRQWLEDTLPAFEMSDVNLVLRPPPRREATAGCSVEHQATLWRGKRRAAPKGSKTANGRGDTPLCRRRPAWSSGDFWARPRGSHSRTIPEMTCRRITGAPSTSVPPSLRSGDVDYRHCLSLTAHASVGSFARPLLDYTAVDLRYDLGSTSGVSSSSHQNPAPVPDARDAPKTMMERMVRAGFDGRARVENETVTAGVTQQILGPVRLRAELRFSPGTAGRAYRKGWQALTRDDKSSKEKEKEKKKREKEDPSLPPRAPRGKPPPRPGIKDAAGTMGSSMGNHSAGAGRFGDAWSAARKEMSGAELVYGIDCPLPPALGAARLVAWYNVNRGEAQAEMRLFDL
jgi:hypothetical protein